MTRDRWVRWPLVALLVVLLGVFTWLNSGESVSLHLGLFQLYQVPVVGVFYLAFLLGMLLMFVLGLRHDLHVRRLLRERGLLDDAPRRLPAASADPGPRPEPEPERLTHAPPDPPV